MAYGILKVDNITFDNGGADQNVTVSGIHRAITSGVTVTGTISGAVLIGTTTVSGATVTGTAVQGTTVQGVSGTFTSLTGTTTTGTTANFVSGVFTTRVSGTTITGNTGQFTSGTFVSLTGTTITGTTVNAVTVSSTTGTFGSITGTTITGTTINGATVNATTGNFTSLTGVTVTGTTARFVSGVFTTQVSGLTVTGTQSSFTSGNFITLSGATATFTSGVIASGTAAAPSLSILGDPNTGIYSPGADQVAVATNGTGRLFINATGEALFTSSASVTGTASAARVQAEGLTAFSAKYNVANSSPPIFEFLKSRAGAIVNSGDSVGQLRFTAWDGTAYQRTAQIQSDVDDTPGTGDMPGRLIFSTTSDSAGTPTERLRIDSAGTTTLTSAAATAPFIAKISATEAARIDSSGRLLVGTSSNRASRFGASSFNSSLQIESNIEAAQSVTRWSADISSGRLHLQKGRGTIAAPTIVLADDTLGDLSFSGYDGVNMTNGARISALVDGTPGANDMPGRLVFSTTADGAASPTERLRITSAGNVGIGTTSPEQLLELSSAAPRLRLTDNNNIASTATTFIEFHGSDFRSAAVFSDSAGINIQADAAGGNNVVLKTNGVNERARIDSSGRLLVGTSTARTIDGVVRQVQIEGIGAGDSSFSVTRNSNDAGVSAILLGKTRGTAIGVSTVVQSEDGIGGIFFTAADGTNVISAASIRASVDGIPGTDDMPGRLVFSTTADGASSPTERLRITSAGVLQIAEAGNITVGTTTGTKIGTATTQKLGFYNATPVVQPTAVADATDAATVITQLNALLAKLRTLGIIAI